MVQYSVYARICGGMDSVNVHRQRLRRAIPERGSVRMLVVTEKQFSNLELLLGEPTELDAPQQDKDLMVF